MGQLGESKYIDLFNAEAQKEFGKNWNDLNADDKQKIASRVRAREAYQKVDPTKNKEILRQKATEKKYKDFATKFKKENGRVPMLTEIRAGVKGYDNKALKKYLKQSEYATPEQALKFKKQVEAKDIPDEMKDWFKKNYPGKDWGKDLNLSQRAGAKLKFENRNNPRVLARDEYKKLDNFLQKKKDSGKILFKGGLEDIAKEAKVNLKAFQVGDYINSKFPNEFVYRGSKISEVPKIRKRVAELAKTLSDKQIYEKLVKEKLINPSDAKEKIDYKNVKKLMASLQKEGKIKKIIKNPTSQYTPQEEKFRDNLVKKFIKENPDIDNAHQIAKRIADNQNIKMSGNFVKSAVARLGLDKELVSRHAKLYPQVAALDKVLKKNSRYILDNNITGGEKFRFLSQKYAEATNQPLAKAAGQLKNRLEKLGGLYQGTSDGRYETKLYSSIKKPIGFNDKFAGNLIEIASQGKTELNNSAIARMLGLPAKDIKLIDDLGKIGAGFDVKMAGDHTDIKALMRDFPNYKKNFLRIQLISDKLNEYKGKKFDRRIITEANRAQTGNPRVQAEAKAEMKKIQKEFKDLTGADIGGFDIRDGRVILKESQMIPRLDQLKNPRNEMARQAMINLETKAKPGEETSRFTNIVDRLLKNATSAAQRINIFKKYQGTKAIQNSKAVNSLSKVPGPVGKAFKTILLGVGGAGVLSFAANAGETSKSEVKQQFSVTEEAKKLPSVPLKYDATVGSIVNATDDKKADQNQILEYVKDNPIKVAAGTSLGFAAEEIPGAYKGARKLGRGKIRSTLGISGALRPVLTTFGTPLVTGLFEGAVAGKRLDEGETMTEVLTDPLGPALGVSLMEPLSKLSGVVRNAPKRTMLEGAKNYFNLSNVGAARPGITGQILRMGMSPKMIAGASRFLGLPGLALGLGMTGYDAYKNYKNNEGMIYNLLNKNE